MSTLYLKQTLKDIEVQVDRFDFCLLTPQHKLKYSALPKKILLGNFQALALYMLFRREPEFRQMPAFATWIPLSYLMPRGDILNTMELHLASPPLLSQVKLAQRNPFNDQSLLALAREMMGLEDAALLLQLKTLFELHLQTEDGLQEMILEQQGLKVLVDLVKQFCKEKSEFFMTKPIPFTRQSLAERGVVFSRGLFYESSGYGLHLFHAIEAQVTIILHTQAEFIKVFYVFLQLMQEIDCLGMEADTYLLDLEDQIRKTKGLLLELVQDA